MLWYSSFLSITLISIAIIFNCNIIIVILILVSLIINVILSCQLTGCRQWHQAQQALEDRWQAFWALI